MVKPSEERSRPASLTMASPPLVRRLVDLLLARKSAVAGILAASLVLNIFGLAAPRFTQFILDSVLPRSDLVLLTQVILVLAIVTIFQILLTILRRLMLVKLSLSVDRVTLAEFFEYVLSLPVSFFKRYKIGDLVARWGDHGHVRHLLAGGLTRVTVDALMVIVFFVLMFTYSVPLALLVIAILLAFAGYTYLQGPVMKRQHRRLLDEKAAQEAQLIEMASGIELVKAMAIEEPLRQRWTDSLARHLESNYRAQRLKQLLESGATAIQFLCSGVVLWYGAVMVMRESFSIGELAAFNMYTAQAVGPLLSLVTLWDEVQLARSALDRIEEVRTCTPETTPSPTTPLYRGSVEGAVRFEQVCFHYGDAENADLLHDLTFEMRPGQIVALVGPSASGKTTVARLLLSLYRPTKGRIFVDGYSLDEWEVPAYRRQIGVVFQDNLLLSGTIRENIAPGEEEPNRERLAEVARIAAIEEFVGRLPNGFDTVVGEFGLQLSGGQRQRIGLARALYREPRILVLDEPFSSLDSLSITAIQQNWHHIRAGRTVLLITHDLSTVQQADQILVMHHGQIVEHGRHGELMAMAGLYRSLVEGCQLNGQQPITNQRPVPTAI
jgi:ATP-binding cassette subfamily B protein